MVIILKLKNNKLLPSCPISYGFYELMKGDYFTDFALRIIKDMGYTIIISKAEIN